LKSSILIAAVSARPFVEMAVEAGFKVSAIDVFADSDTAQLCESTHQIHYANHGFDQRDLLKVFSSLNLKDYRGVAYGSGFESSPMLLEEISKRIKLLGNSAQTLSRVKSPKQFFEVLGQYGIRFPEVQFLRPAIPAGWLQKNAGGSGGMHIQVAQDASATEGGVYYQKSIPGTPVSALFLANGSLAKVIGFNEQWISPCEQHPYRYGGMVSHTDLALPKDEIAKITEQLTGAFGLKGLNTLDGIWDGNNFWVLEINPRLSSSANLYHTEPISLFSLHVAACQGEMPMFSVEPDPIAREVLYAPKSMTIPPMIHWPSWVKDRPQAGIIINKDQPICTLIAKAHSVSQAIVKLKSRKEEISRLLFS
jgi:uncharacterized protein